MKYYYDIYPTEIHEGKETTQGTTFTTYSARADAEPSVSDAPLEATAESPSSAPPDSPST